LLSPDSHSAFSHDDFLTYNAPEVVPSYFFVGNFLFDVFGPLFLIAIVLSLLVCFSKRKVFSQILVSDLICLTTIVSVVSVNTILGAGLNLSFPYNNVAKYNYQSLLFFSLLAASLLGKCLSLFSSLKSKKKLNIFLFIIALFGLILLASSMLRNRQQVYQHSTMDHVLFRVEMDKDVGYFLINTSPNGKYSFPIGIQYLGFAFVLSGFAWASRNRLRRLLKLTRK
jgi:hypothetical protein